MISRRNFIRNGAIAAGAFAISNPLFGASNLLKPAKGAKQTAVAAEKVVVVVNLFGGNDGLNTVVPVNASQYNKYLQLRGSLAYNQGQLLSLNGEPDFMLNPGMTGFQNLFNNGRLAIINGVSVPQEAIGLFDHEAGQYEFQSCDIIRNLAAGPSTGWLGRYLDTVPDPQPGQVLPGLDFGGGRLMLTGQVREPVSIESIENFQLQLSYDEVARRQRYLNAMNIPNPGGGVAELNRNYRLQALAQSQIIQSATANYVASVTYPDTYLGSQMKDCAKIIVGDIGARVLAVGSSGFDTHSGQNDVADGIPYHEFLLKDVSDSIAAFYQDLINQGHSQRVLILTISEFGRRGYKNNDDGTDHGFGSVAFATGDMVNGGIFGWYPDLNNLVLDGSLDMTNDFRSLYATVLANYLQVDPQPILDPTDQYPDFPTLGFI